MPFEPYYLAVNFVTVRGRKYYVQNGALDLNYTGITDITEISGLEHLTDLQKLDLNNNKIKEIKGLEHLTNLKRLDLWENQIEEIKGLEHLTSLQRLDLRYNKIEEISGLEHLTNLRELDLSYNMIEEISGLEHLTNLQRLDLRGNPIKEGEKYLLGKNVLDIVRHCQEKVEQVKQEVVKHSNTALKKWKEKIENRFLQIEQYILKCTGKEPYNLANTLLDELRASITSLTIKDIVDEVKTEAKVKVEMQKIIDTEKANLLKRADEVLAILPARLQEMEEFNTRLISLANEKGVVIFDTIPVPIPENITIEQIAVIFKSLIDNGNISGIIDQKGGKFFSNSYLETVEKYIAKRKDAFRNNS